MSEYYHPVYQSKQFHCPYCNVFASQEWSNIATISIKNTNQKIQGMLPVKNENKVIRTSTCSHCQKRTIWLEEKIIYPTTHSAPQSNNDLPDNVKEIYDEAAKITDQSPRAACALLRLALQMLLEKLGGSGNINDDIKNLVKKGLNLQIQQALDIVRVTGNHAVHPGEIVFDDTTNVQGLFDLINIIADVFITQPKRMQKLYDNLPETDKKKITKRDGKTK